MTHISHPECFDQQRLWADQPKSASAVQLRWEGAAATAQAEGFRLWAEGAQDVITGIADMRTAATTAHQQYTDAVTLNLRMLGRQ